MTALLTTKALSRCWHPCAYAAIRMRHRKETLLQPPVKAACSITARPDVLGGLGLRDHRFVGISEDGEREDGVRFVLAAW